MRHVKKPKIRIDEEPYITNKILMSMQQTRDKVVNLFPKKTCHRIFFKVFEALIVILKVTGFLSSTIDAHPALHES